MPITAGVFARIWKFIDQRQAGDHVTRQDLDTALDDFVPAVNSALSVLTAATAAKDAAEAAVVDAEAAGALAGAAAGAAAAEAAAAPLTAAAAASASDAADSAVAAAASAAIISGVTATPAELNVLDGITATTAELNYVDGVTSAIQTQLDARQPFDADLTALAAIAGAEGDLIYRNATVWTRLAKGAAGQLLQQNAGLTAPEWVTPDICKEIGTVNTSSGTTQTLSGLDLSSYKALLVCINGVSWGASDVLTMNTTQLGVTTGGAANARAGFAFIDLSGGWATAVSANVGSAGTVSVNTHTMTTATTSLSFSSVGASTFDAGSIRVLGIR